MILRVILKNFLSFNDEVQFDMFPNIKRTTLSNHMTMLDGKLPVLKMAAVYGANGAGKSNLLKGINFLKTIATNKNFLNGDSVGRYMFALKEDAGDDPEIRDLVPQRHRPGCFRDGPVLHPRP